MSPLPNTVRKSLTAMRLVGIVLLIGLYLVGLAKFASVHESLHEPSLAALHSQLNELDPCHRSLFHNDPKGCAHKTHLTTFSNCPLCGIAIHSEYAPGENVEVNIVIDSTTHFDKLRSIDHENTLVHYLLRGPPTFVV